MSELTSCTHTDEDDHDFPQWANLLSTILLCVIALVGLGGNILVLLVYSIKKKRSFKHFPAKKSKAVVIKISPRSSGLTTQRYLIICLATVDLITCITILPWDIYKSIERIVESDQIATKEYLHNLDDLFKGLRNIAFACEGSILAAIALDRFFTVVFSAPLVTSARNNPEQARPMLGMLRQQIVNLCCCSNSKQDKENSNKMCFCCRRSQVEAEILACSCGLVRWEELDRETQKSYSCFQDCFCCGFRVSKQERSSGRSGKCLNKFITRARLRCIRMRKYFVWGSILLISLAVATAESIVFLIHMKEQGECPRSTAIRKEADSVYLYSTMISGVFILFMYLRVFHTAHRQDRRTRRKHLRRENIDQILQNSRRYDNETEFETSRPPETSNEDGPTYNTRGSRRPVNSVFCARLRTCYSSVFSSRSNGIRSRRTGLMLCISTVVFYATLLPVFLKHGHNLKINIFIHHEFYYINNAINVLIYSILNPNFRNRLKHLREDFMQ
ncbi:hypothetical protein Ciccas_007060 [Cichlidogyrus casuarinus]|uniref:G-protein coupled receptors family 1 profile domain-containing protein n=1 Tax=Cichlidogyrus casuarinus TaxID=1844966 RepID=A0ABD2Q3Z5_9PLAT